jgi:hypothetical protein
MPEKKTKVRMSLTLAKDVKHHPHAFGHKKTSTSAD